MGNLFSLDLFLEVKINGETYHNHCSPATETQIHQINSRKSELIASSPATQLPSFRNVISTEAFLVRQQPALTQSRLLHPTLLFLNACVSRGFVGSRLTEISFRSTFPPQWSFL